MRGEGNDEELLRLCAEKSRALLDRNRVPEGILAASPTPRAMARNYDRVFARDAMISSLFMLRSRDRSLEGSAIASIDSLANGQAANGQIPNFVGGGVSDWWYIGCPDATLWWLIAVDEARHLLSHIPDVKTRWKLHADLAIQWLLGQEHQGFFLIPQGVAADWADVMPRSGFVLYTNALWYAAKRRWGLSNMEQTRRRFNQFFLSLRQSPPIEDDDRRAHVLLKYAHRGHDSSKSRTTGLGLSFVTLTGSGREGDVMGNVLSILSGVVGYSRARSIIDVLHRAGVADRYPVRALVTPIVKKHKLWCKYMTRHRQNHPWQYHNGGYWPVIGGFWVLALVALGQMKQAREDLVKLARANELGSWRFSELLHGRTCAPSGMPDRKSVV